MMLVKSRNSEPTKDTKRTIRKTNQNLLDSEQGRINNTHKNPIAQNQVKANDAHDCFAKLSDWIIYLFDLLYF
jgi:hypothetical protein